jgi:transcriptional regulator with XRE-family HTH domain
MTKKKRKQLTDQIRQAVESCGLSRYEIAKQTGLDESALAKFVNGRRGFSMESLNVLAEFLELEIVMHRKPEQNGK